MPTNDHTHLRDVFGEAFRRYGPPTTVPNVDPSSYSIPYDVRTFFPDIYCDFVDTDDLNAMACIYKGHELVVLFAGLIHFINPYYAAFLSDPLMFQEIGDPSKDRRAGEVNEMRVEFLRNYPTQGFAPLSVCPVRSRAILRVIWCANLFLHAHEVAHIVLGHLDLLTDECGTSAYEELPIAAISEEEGDLRRALELQADQSAALTSLHLFRKQLEEHSDSSDEELKDADLLWSIAVESLFVLLELAMVWKGIRGSVTHPSPFTRWLNVKLNVLEQAEEHGIRPLRLPEEGSRPINQVRTWLTTNGLADGRAIFPSNHADISTDELFSTWETILPYESKLEHYRAIRGNRARSRVSP